MCSLQWQFPVVLTTSSHHLAASAIEHALFLLPLSCQDSCISGARAPASCRRLSVYLPLITGQACARLPPV
jgi:hypothetical protein